MARRLCGGPLAQEDEKKPESAKPKRKGSDAAMKALWERKVFSRVGLWLAALLFAAVMTLGESFMRTGSTQGLLGSGAALWKGLLLFLAQARVYYALMFLLQNALSKPFPRDENAFVKRKAFFWAAAGALLLCWLPYWICTFPGTVSNDSITQMQELLGVKPLSAGNPLAQTYLLKPFVELGVAFHSPDGAIAAYCGLQALAMAFLLAATLKDMALAAAPRWLVVGAFAFYALCPVFPVFAFCVGKDTNFAMAVLWLMMAVWRALAVKTGEKLPWGVSVGLCLSAALVALLRNPGVYMAGLTLFCLVLGTLAQKQCKLPLVALCVAMAAFVLVQYGMKPLVKAEPMPETEEYSIPLQQVARVVASQPESLTAAEKAAISGVLAFERIKEEYNGELSDPIKFLWKEEATKEQKAAFFQTWLALLRKHPATCLSATFHNTYGYLRPGYMSSIKPTLLLGEQMRDTRIKDQFDFTINPLADKLEAFLNRLPLQPVFHWLIAPGLYGWITVFGLCTLLRGRPRRLIIAALPMLLALLGCILSAVNGYFRYAMPLYFGAPLLLALCSQALSSPKGEEKP